MAESLSGGILVAEDNRMNRLTLARYLERHGFLVTAVENGRQALDQVRAQRFDLLILDVMMPELSGLEVLAAVRVNASTVELPVIMATALDESTDIVRAFELGANDYVTKPIDFPVLLARMRTHLTLKRLNQLKDEFLAIASHDLKNPLTTIFGAACTMEILVPQGQVMNEDGQECVMMIKTRSQIMRRIIADFLDFQAMEDGQLKIEPTDTDVNEIIRQSVACNQSYAQEKSIQLTHALDPQLTPIRADSMRLMQVVENFVSNAIKFSPPGAKANVTSRIDGNHLLVEVTDSGPGLTEADRQRLFVKYARLSNLPTGGEKSSGLGLSICKTLIELHGGTIGARTNPTGGSTFWFRLTRNGRPASS